MGDCVRVGLIGNGHWGRVYVKTFEKLGEPLAWVTSRDTRLDADAIIIATPAETHYDIAKAALSHGCHVLIEKPMCLRVDHARALLELAKRMGVVGFVGHTHLYSPAWREVKKAAAGGVVGVYSVSGGPCKTDPVFDWGAHDVAMRMDIGGEFAPHDMQITKERVKRCFTVVTKDGELTYDDPFTDPRPMDVLIREFLAACGEGRPDTQGMELGVKVTEALCA